MYNKRRVGSTYEQISEQYLIEHGYHIIEKNFQCRTGEIDIIAKDQEYLVFVEVKYRMNTGKGRPEEAVDFRKIKKISRTAQFYLLIHGLASDIPCRFDVVTILDKEITLIKNAFEASF